MFEIQCGPIDLRPAATPGDLGGVCEFTPPTAREVTAGLTPEPGVGDA